MRPSRFMTAISLATTVITLGGTVVQEIPATAAPVADQKAPTSAESLPPLGSTPAPRPIPTRPDVSNLPSRSSGFDPTTSTVIDALTTPTSQTFQNADGSRTVNTSLWPVREKGSDGVWRPIDLTLESEPDGSFGPTRGLRQHRIGA